MSTDSESDGEIEYGIRKDLTDAKIRLNHAVENWTQVQRLSADQRELAREELHSAVIGLWVRMEPNLRDGPAWDDLSGFDSVDRDHIWHGTDPETGQPVTISGLSDLDEWIQRTVIVNEEISSPRAASGQQTYQRRVRLPVEAAVAVARLLSLRYHQLGWDVEGDEQENQTKITDDLLQEVDQWRRENINQE